MCEGWCRIMDYPRLLQELAALPAETEWVEFKSDYVQPEQIGEYISAMANSAVLMNRDCGYLVWGVKNDTYALEGTVFNPKAASAKVKGEELEIWISVRLNPRIDFKFERFEHNGKHFVICTVPAARYKVVEFNGAGYIRVGSAKTNLNTQPEKLRSLLLILNQYRFESEVAVSGLSLNDALTSLDVVAYYSLVKRAEPADREAVALQLIEEKFLRKNDDGSYAITNLGAILFARDLSRFEKLAGKRVRIVTFAGKDKLQRLREDENQKGYAAGFAEVIRYIGSQLPTTEVFHEGVRTNVLAYPELAFRELTANMLIHQDFTLTGTAPIVDIYLDRIEFTNLGKPLIATDRFVGAIPRTRNEQLAAFMRRAGICEQEGSGCVKVVDSVERNLMPAPDFLIVGDHTVAVLYGPRALTQMSEADQIRACYQHACKQWAAKDVLTNSSVRSRFGISDENSAQVSRIIRVTLEAGKIKKADGDTGSRKYAKYVPYWV
ncbi:MAG: putative DNA binding domain-containing protein [Calditrichaeota bacterium]|nr:putative DNA binding domain-containing protein [Calditrichota bacterium]